MLSHLKECLEISMTGQQGLILGRMIMWIMMYSFPQKLQLERTDVFVLDQFYCFLDLCF